MTKRLAATICFVSLLLGAHAAFAAAATCFEQFFIRSSELSRALPASTHLDFLGEGNNGQVFLAIDANGHRHAVKEYFDRDRLVADVERFEMLREIHQEMGPAAPFDIPKFRTNDGELMFLDYAEGKVLRDILHSENPADDGFAMQVQYDRMIEAIRKHLTDKRTMQGGFGAVFEIRDVFGETIRLFLHSANIVVTKNKRLVVIDPY